MKRVRTNPVAKLLGASKVRRVAVGHSPWDLYHLLDSLRLQLTPGKGRGRPTNPSWTIRRLVGFSRETWRDLVRLARTTRKQGTPRLTPAQIASWIIEDSIRRSRSKRARTRA